MSVTLDDPQPSVPAQSAPSPAPPVPLPPAVPSRRRPHELRILRRKLILASAPIVLLAILAALRFLSLNVVANQAITAYEAKDKKAAMDTAERLGWVNLVERWRYPFAIGDAHVVAAHEDLARPWFESALDLVPKGGRDECVVRVNLGLVYEHLGDLAAAREHADEARQFYEKGLATTKIAPNTCDKPDASNRNPQQELNDANKRMTGKNGALPPPNSTPTPGPTNPTPVPTNPPNQDKLDQLEQQRQQNQQDHENGKQDNEIPTQPPPDPNVKPW